MSSAHDSTQRAQFDTPGAGAVSRFSVYHGARAKVWYFLIHAEPSQTLRLSDAQTLRLCISFDHSISICAVLVGGSNGDGAWRGLVTIVELIDPG